MQYKKPGHVYATRIIYDVIILGHFVIAVNEISVICEAYSNLSNLIMMTMMILCIFFNV